MPTSLLLAEQTEGGTVDWGMILTFLGGGGIGGVFTGVVNAWWGRASSKEVHELATEKADVEQFDVFTTKLMARLDQQDKKIDQQDEKVERLGKALEDEKRLRRNEHEDWDRRFAVLRLSFRSIATLFRQLQEHVQDRNRMLDRWFPTGIPADFPRTPEHLLTPFDDDWDDQVGG